MNLFGRKKAAPAAPRLNDAILALKAASETLEKREEHLIRCKSEARAEGLKKMKAKDKNGAMFFLRRIKMYDKEISQLYGKRSNLDTQIMALQGAAVDKNVIQAMQTAHHATKAAINENDIDRVQDLMDDIRETADTVDQVGEALAQPINGDMDEIDEDELLAAFEEEEEVDTEVDLAAVGLPSAPSKTTVSPKQQEEDELAAVMDLPSAPSSKPQTAPAAKADPQADELKKLEALMNM